MGLFNRNNVIDPRYEAIESKYMSIMSPSIGRDELIDTVDVFLEICGSFSSDDEAKFQRYVIKHGKPNRRTGAIEHPVFGSFFTHDSILHKIIINANGRKQNALNAIAKEKEFKSIDVIIPIPNTGYELKRHTMAEIPEIKIQNITKSFNIDAKMPAFVVLDLETTGLSPGKDRIVQLAAIRYENKIPTEAFVSLINPKRSIPEEASNVNGIKDEDVIDAPELSHIAESFVEFIGKSPILGYNISFDLSFLFCSGIDLISKRKIYDAKPLAKKLYKRDIDYYSLKNVLEYNGIYINSLHDAKADCYATGLVFLQMVDEITS